VVKEKIKTASEI